MIAVAQNLPAEAEGADASIPVLPRPRVLDGATYRTETPLGTAFITVNWKAAGGGREPFEVFLSIGKAGSDIAALAEAIGRLCSLCLRLPGPVPAHKRVAVMVGQLRGIGGERSVGFGAGRVRSLPDALARVLAEELGPAPHGAAPDAPVQTPAAPEPCPSCGESLLVNQEDGPIGGRGFDQR